VSRIHLCAVVFILACGPGRFEDGTAETVESGEETNGETGVPADMLSDADKDELDALGDELQQIAEAAVAWFEASELPHRCPHLIGTPEGGDSVFTPELSLNCNEGPDHRCIPSDAGESGGGYYSSTWWVDHPIWVALGFEKTEPHSFHYNFEATNTLDGYGACTFTVQARGDLDDDALFSTYSIRGTIDENGSVIEPLEIIDPHE
jgi:hypothetical protein